MILLKHGSRYLPAWAFLFFCQAITALADSAWSSRAWQSDDGLPNNRITGLAQTRDGYLWIATPTRLARFDGDHFEAISRETFAPGMTQRTSRLLQGRDGGLWLGMDHGPVIYAKAGTTHIFTNGLPDEDVQTFTEDAGGGLWITYRGGMVCRLMDEKISRFTAADGLRSGRCVRWRRTARGECGSPRAENSACSGTDVSIRCSR